MAKVSNGGVALIVLALVTGGGIYGYNSMSKSVPAQPAATTAPSTTATPVQQAPVQTEAAPVAPQAEAPAPVVEKHAMPKREHKAPEHHVAKKVHKPEFKPVHRGTQEHHVSSSAPSKHNAEDAALRELAGQ